MIKVPGLQETLNLVFTVALPLHYPNNRIFPPVLSARVGAFPGNAGK